LVTAAQLARDYATLRSLRDAVTPWAGLAGIDIAFQIPVLGEIVPMYPEYACSSLTVSRDCAKSSLSNCCAL
jgi:hypothetical protein